jgi:hypothetical protein
MSDLNVFLGEVQTNVNGGHGTGIYWNIEATIYVRNLSYNKSVGLWMLVAGTWRAFQAAYSSPLIYGGGGIIEKWIATASPETGLASGDHIYRYAAFYHDLDHHVSCWDNNFGRDYYLIIHV